MSQARRRIRKHAADRGRHNCRRPISSGNNNAIDSTIDQDNYVLRYIEGPATGLSILKTRNASSRIHFNGGDDGLGRVAVNGCSIFGGRHMKIRWAVAACALMGASSTTIHGQAVRDARSAEAPVGIEEIVVSAQRRAENLQDVPIAVSANGCFFGPGRRYRSGRSEARRSNAESHQRLPM